MSPTMNVLENQRDKIENKQKRNDKQLAKERADVDECAELIKEERKDTRILRDKRQDVMKLLAQEAAADKRGEGEKSEEWERRKLDRADEYADMIDASVSRTDRLLERLVLQEQDVTRVLERDAFLDQRLVIVERKIERKKDKDSNQLTPHFSFVEFDCNDGTPCPIASKEAAKQWCIEYGEPLREKFGPVHFNSAFRTRIYNISVGGASMSIHVYDGPWQHAPFAVAVDHVVATASPAQVQAWHEANTHPDGMGRYSVFTHVDNRNRIGWATSRWYGS